VERLNNSTMGLGIITFLSAITISAVAIYYSVAGLAAIFAAAVIPIIVMGVSLEVGKLVTAVWLHRNWHRAVWWLRTYLAIAVLVLMFITSMGIFGFLSKAHIEQTSMSQEQVALIETLDDKETRAQAKIERWRSELDRLMKGEDVRVDGLIEKEQEGLDKIYARIKQEKDGLRADANSKIEQQQLRITQAQERRDAEIAAAEKKFEGSFGGSKQYEDAVNKAKQNELSVASRAQKEILAVNEQLDIDLKAVDTKYAKDIADINKRINDLRNQANNKTQDIEGRITELEGFIETEQKVVDGVREEKFGYEKEYRKLEAEVGPVKYIAEFIYGEEADNNLLEEAVRWVIIVIILVFDPLAVLLLIASQYSFEFYRKEKGGSLPGKPNPDPDPEGPKDEDDRTENSENTEERIQTSSETQDEESIQGSNEDDPTVAGTEEKVEPQLSKKKEGQYLLWNDIDPDTIQPHEFVEEEKYVDPNQQELDFDAPVEEKESPKQYVRTANPFFFANEKVNDEVDSTITNMKEEGDWPKVQDDLDAWNSWVDKANAEAEANPEGKEQYTEVIEPQGFVQNEEQKTGIWNQIESKRQDIDSDAIRKLEISEQQYRDASQRKIAETVERIKKGTLSIDDVKDEEKDKILSALEKEADIDKEN